MSVYTDQPIFDALAAATHIDDGRVVISASKFIEVFNGHRDRQLCRSLDGAVIEQCARVAEKAWPRANTYASENADLYRGQDHAVRTVVKAIRALAPSPSHGETP